MGIIVIEKEVFFSKIENDVNSGLKNNPKKIKRNGIYIYSVFSRGMKDYSNDGNPLIYALKNKKGYKIKKRELIKFKKNFYKILEIIIKEVGVSNAVLVTIPSSSNVNSIFAQRVSRKFKIQLREDIFEKSRIKDVINKLENNIDSIAEKDKKEIKKNN